MVWNSERAQRESRLSDLKLELVEADVTAPDSLAAVVDGVRAIVHTVAIAIEKGKGGYEQVNYQGTVNLVRAAQAAGMSRFINLSQLGADPSLPYRFLASKGKAQAYVAESKLDWTAFRPSVIWGPEDEFANTFAKLVPFSPLIFPIIGDETSRFQPVWVEDVVTCIVKALDDSSTVRGDYELGGPEVLTLEEIEQRTFDAIGVRRAMVRVPLALLRVVVAAMETALPSPPVTRSLLELLAVSNVTTKNALPRFVPEPRPFAIQHLAEYMTRFSARSTITQFLSR
jgi:NADH dehydrogenase